MTKIECHECGEKHDRMHMICECTDCYQKGCNKEIDKIIKEAQAFNGQIVNIYDLFEHMKRLQSCSHCKRDFYDKLCPSCYVPKSALREKSEKNAWGRTYIKPEGDASK